MDTKWLQKIGVRGSSEELAELEELIGSALELRVGSVIAEALSEEQIDEFEGMMGDDFSDDERLEWIGEAFPRYSIVVTEETARLRKNILQSNDKIEYIRQLT